MDHSKTALERAFELAASGTCKQLWDIRTTLKAEGLDDKQIVGREIGRQLRERMRAAWEMKHASRT